MEPKNATPPPYCTESWSQLSTCWLRNRPGVGAPFISFLRGRPISRSKPSGKAALPYSPRALARSIAPALELEFTDAEYWHCRLRENRGQSHRGNSKARLCTSPGGLRPRTHPGRAVGSSLLGSAPVHGFRSHAFRAAARCNSYCHSTALSLGAGGKSGRGRLPHFSREATCFERDRWATAHR